MNFHLKDYLSKESRLKNIDSYTIFQDIPIWRIVRNRIRGIYIGSNDKTVDANISLKLLVSFCKSATQLIYIILTRKHYDNVIFPHPRLFWIGNVYLERLTDPLIDYTDIKKSYIIFERWQNGIHKHPRIHNENCKYWDSVSLTSLIFSRLFGKFLVRKYRFQIDKLLAELSLEFEIPNNLKSIIIQELSSFVVSYKLTSYIIKATSPKRIFLAPRSTFNYVIAYCKKYKITSYELQHGITLGKTKLYSGSYNNAIDPDYFLTFGKDNISEHFGIPLDKIFNIGFAYGSYVKNLQNINLQNKNILVISESRITKPLLDTTLALAKKYTEWQFDFRCHPQEALSHEQQMEIGKQSNLSEVSNKEESFYSISKYQIILGENSSVLFEALYLGKKVGRLNFNGLMVNSDSSIQGGIIINSFEEFDIFINSECSGLNRLSLYSEFNPELVNNLK